MKKLLLLLISVLFLNITFTGCKKEPDVLTLNDLYGTWHGTEIIITSTYQTFNIAEHPEYAFSFEFRKDNTYNSVGYFGDTTGKYELGKSEYDGSDLFCLYVGDTIVTLLSYWQYNNNKKKECRFEIYHYHKTYTVKMKRKQ